MPFREPISTFRQKLPEEEIKGVPSFSDLPMESSTPKEEPLPPVSPEAATLYRALTAQPVSAEELAYQLSLPIEKIFQAATELELSGKIQSFSAGVTLKKGNPCESRPAAGGFHKAYAIQFIMYFAKDL